MADLTRTKCGRIQNQEKSMLNHEVISPYFKACYKNIFSPLVPKSCYFAQNLMGCHSEVFAFSKSPNFFNKMLHKINFKRWFR